MEDVRDNSAMLIVGLGNPGSAYANTRHNLGQFVLNSFAREQNLKWINNKRLNADLAQGRHGKCRYILARPLSFMNNSGYPVRRVADYFKIDPKNVVILYDEINLPLGEVKITHRLGDGGHNGMADICEKLGECVRFRIGVGAKSEPQQDLKDYVLGKFSDEEQAALLYALPNILTRLVELLNETPAY